VNDMKTIELAFDILDDAEVIEEFEDSLWLKVDKYLYAQFLNGYNQGEKTDD